MDVVVTVLLIFFARLADVTMGTMRNILNVRGQRKIAPVIGFFEIMIWAVAVSQVIPELNLNKIHYLLAFAAGFAAGNFLGGYLEEKIALGYIFAYIVPKNHQTGLAEELRKAGFGLTTEIGHGLEGPHTIYNTVFRRRDLKQFLEIIKAHDKEAFYSIMDIRSYAGGTIRRAAKKK